MFERGWFEQLLPVTEIAQRILRDINHSETLDMGLILNTIGSTYCEIGIPSKAKEYHTQVRHIRESLLPPRDPVISNILHNLAIDNAGYGDYKTAKELCATTISIREELPDETHRNYKAMALPKNYTTYCRILYLEGDLDSAENNGRKALELAQKNLGLHHQNTAQLVLTPTFCY